MFKPKVVILCGGLGSRLSEETKIKPKPMIKIGRFPILIHVMNIYSKFGINDFILALGYKKNYIIDYFKNFKNPKKWNIQLVDTGKNSLTATRLMKLKKFLKNEDYFLLTYGDGVSNLNIKKLISFHKKNKKIATVTAVRPPARFGELTIFNSFVKKFDEKNQINSGWINGGFFVFNNKIFNLIPNKNSMLERETMKNLTKKNQLGAYKHYSFWKCMDTIRDKEVLSKIWKSNRKQW